MRFSQVVVAGLASIVAAQRPSNVSICDYYTTALLKENNSTNQLTVLTLIVNTALIGNYSTINVNVSVPGLLNKGTYKGANVNLLPYFDGSLVSSNRGSPRAVNFLDDGGAAPLMKSMASNGNTTSNQYRLLTHLYSYFGILAGCSQVGMGAYPAYTGQTSQYKVHQYMDLNPAQLGYFIQNVGLAAASFGVATEDVNALGTALNQTFGYRCGPVAAVPPTAAPESQSICTDSTCPVAANSSCANVANGTAPAFVNGTNFTNPTPSGSGNGSQTSGGGAARTSNPAALVEAGGLLGLAGMVALAVL